MARPVVVQTQTQSQTSSTNDATHDARSEYEPGYEWVALSVTTVGALLAAVQGSSLVIALPDVLTGLNSTFLTVMWVLLGYLLITTALVPVVGRLADMVGRKRLYVAGFAVFTLGSLLAGFSQPQGPGPARSSAVC